VPGRVSVPAYWYWYWLFSHHMVQPVQRFSLRLPQLNSWISRLAMSDRGRAWVVHTIQQQLAVTTVMATHWNLTFGLCARTEVTTQLTTPAKPC